MGWPKPRSTPSDRAATSSARRTPVRSGATVDVTSRTVPSLRRRSDVVWVFIYVTYMPPSLSILGGFC